MVVRVRQRAESLWTRVALRRVASTCHMISHPISMKTTRGYQTPATKTVLSSSFRRLTTMFFPTSTFKSTHT